MCLSADTALMTRLLTQLIIFFCRRMYSATYVIIPVQQKFVHWKRAVDG